LLTLLLKMASLISSCYMDFEDSNLTAKFTFLPVIYVIAIALRNTGFYEFIFRLFFVSTFRRKLNKLITIIIISALIAIFSYGGYVDLRISPYFINLAINFFIAVLFIVAFVRWDFMTVWISALAYCLLRELYPMIYFDNGFLMWNGISMWIIFGIMCLVGIIGYFRKVDIREIQRYVPSYLIRREERERLQREFEIARRVQFSFLPREKPKLKGIDLASICIPAMEVGGDYYDFIELDDHRLGVVIGDVSGKGISAAFHMTLTKGFLKSQAKSGLSPREIMINLNELFYENVERGTFISMIYGIFDLQSRTFTFARAGHNPLLIQKGMDDKVEILCPKGLALGLEKGTLFERVIEEYTIGIQSNDIFVFYTDGFSEAMNNKKEEFGEDRLQKLLQKNSLPSAEHIINHIKTEIINFVGDAPQHDDMTMLVVKIL
jgi:sigma-B regulation protein RsbU (phosphoserine phosphatase)